MIHAFKKKNLRALIFLMLLFEKQEIWTCIELVMVDVVECMMFIRMVLCLLKVILIFVVHRHQIGAS